MQTADLVQQPAPLLPGFAQLSRKEFLEAARSKRLIAFVTIMTLALVLVPVVGYLRIDYVGDGSRHRISPEQMDDLVATWAGICAYLGSLMVIASTVDTVSHERSLGISAWIMTKPVSRAAYLASKVVVHTATACATLVLFPGIVWLAVTTAMFADVPFARIFGATAILSVEMLFLATLVVALGVAFRAVVWIAILSLGAWFIPTIVPAIATLDWTYHVLPSYLPVAAVAAIYDGTSEAFVVSVPIASVILAAVIFAAAVTLFEQQEL